MLHDCCAAGTEDRMVTWADSADPYKDHQSRNNYINKHTNSNSDVLKETESMLQE